MPDTDFDARLARIAQNRQSEVKAPAASGARGATYRDRLDRALAVAAAAGISRDAGFPPLMRGLAAISVPVRPLHFKSVLSLFVSGVLLGVFVFGGVLWLVLNTGFAIPARGPIATMVWMGWQGVAAVSFCLGVAFAIAIRAQALRAGLPRWHDL